MAKGLEDSNICPIYKRKSKRDLRNYRPIALLEIPSRIFERIIAQKLVHHAITMNILAPDQAAFLPGRCTGDVIVVCGGTSSSLFCESAGVCQGSCLGPVLWLYFFSPIHSSAVGNAGPGLSTYTFADDHTQGSKDPHLLTKGEAGAVAFTNGARITMEPAKKVVGTYANRAPKSQQECAILLGLRLDAALSMSNHFDTF
ncbi:conserved hypothetical protein [Perkinsus marinus ATCC 50983]|uniref:Reverse transcriptase domain-containing protein n=1 Tax=Perkinsus marinus (strain ATCC 50983 / TXsc) TaxID=423536 RepID=C5LGB4_PERM5|nr:conserved hypothetical protein [Perkinsus marinus ATCC 50983]EER04228.1 conserved hypothetical protein [Perkinsus marinus ATCC 50983]|eukprot:XP_002772412.1 conserved hypothetical protein [Perkinsus marinus ATCC 50983]